MLLAALLLSIAAAGGSARAVRPPPPWTLADPILAGVLTPLDGTTTSTGCSPAPGLCSVRLRAGAGGGSSVRLATRPGERFFGMGERFGSLDLDGQVLSNRAQDGMGDETGTSYSPTPFLLSSSGYGLQVHTTADVTVDFGTAGEVVIDVAAADTVVDVLTGPAPAAVLARRAAVVGLPPVPPAWGLGVWKSLIGGPERVLADTDRLLADGVPLDAVWIYDITDPTSGIGWAWPIYRPVPIGRYPDPGALIAELHRRGLRVMGYLSPFLVPGTPGFGEAAARGYLVRHEDGSVFTEPWMDADRRAYLDFTNPAATVWWQDRLRHAVGVLGFDGAMQDYGDHAPMAARYADGTPGTLMRNTYPVLYARAAREAVQSVKPDATVLFARSGYTGSQAWVTGRFTGDQTRDWDPSTGLPAVLAGMLNGSVSGWPYWGPDIGGFMTGDGPGERDRELWDRWVQLGALSPVMRDMLGEQEDPLGVQSDPATLATFRGYARLHEALEPYLVGLATAAGATGQPLMRPLWLDDPSDPTAWMIENQYLLGPDVLVAPVVTAGTTRTAVYLSAGRWRDYWTGREHPGRSWVTVDATHHIPLFTRAGSPVALPPPEVLGLPD
ncbi:TIM-barrel domain-containing protein [Actinomycetospora sp. CA-101289]|uniref:TIM-barrel domain-containing protein n=1 Tax=Actinomycetospora sp. CA-101289 TaxID=3239893 RepID=UPI003D99CD69